MAQQNEYSLCFICSNSVSQCTSSNEGSKSTLSYEICFEFFNFAELYLQFNASDWCYDSKLEVFCDTCLERLKKICVLYEDLCEAELQLSSKLRELGKVLRTPPGNVFVKEEIGENTTSFKDAGVVADIRNFLASKCLKEVENVKIKRIEGRSDVESSEESILETGNDDGDVKYEVDNFSEEEAHTGMSMESKYDPLSASNNAKGTNDKSSNSDMSPVEQETSSDDSEEEVEMEEGSFSSYKITLSSPKTECDSEEDDSGSEVEETNDEPGNEESFEKNKDEMHECPRSGLTFPDKQALTKHLSDGCDKFPEKNTVDFIYAINQFGKRVRKVRCTLCGKFFRKNSMKLHLATHIDIKERQVVCDICGASYSSERNLKSHVNIIHKGNKRKRVECQHCGKSFSSQQPLNTHVDKVHKGIDLSVICEVCGKVLSGQNHYKKHLKTHTDEKRHACHLCPHRYKTRKCLKVHLVRDHGKTKGKEFTPGEGIVLKSICMFQSCDVKFGTSEELQSHVEQNHAPAGNKEFMCKLCGKVLANQARLTRHNLVHTQEKPHACHLCSKAFALKASLKLHLETFHNTGNEQFACEQPNCKSKFKLRKRLWNHMRGVHGLTPSK